MGVFSLFENSYSEKRKKYKILCIQDYVMHTKNYNLHAKLFFPESVFRSSKFGMQLKKQIGAFSILLEKFFFVAIKKR